MKKLSSFELLIMAAASLIMIALSAFRLWPIPLAEVFGFATGGICVWLAVREEPLNWPVGLLNNIFFFYLFFHARLFADMGLQVVYFALGVWGWWNWLKGGRRGGVLLVSRTMPTEWIILSCFTLVGTLALRELLIVVNGAAPFVDALTTILSLCAQYLMCQKRVECWLFWMSVDLISVPLYVSRGLPLIAVLYFVFLLMCIAGLRAWIRSLRTGIQRPHPLAEACACADS